jgi:WD repeat-containing protein 23
LDDLYPKIPSEAGTELMRSGHYGSDAYYVDALKHRRKRLASKLMWRELGFENQGAEKRANQAISQVGPENKHL